MREALFPSGSEEKLMFVLRASVRKIIDFCEGDLGCATRLLSTGSLERSENGSPLMKLTSTINRFRDLFRTLILRLFEENFQKRNMLIIDRTRWEFGYQISCL